MAVTFNTQRYNSNDCNMKTKNYGFVHLDNLITDYKEEFIH